MSGCGQFEAAVSALLDGVLTETEQRALEAHLAACPACRTYLADQEAIRDALRELDAPAPEGFGERVMAQIRAQGRRKVIRLPQWRRWAAVAACCAVVVLGALALGMNGPDPADSAGGAALYGRSGTEPCGLMDGQSLALPEAAAYAGVLTTDSGVARTWVEANLAAVWTAGGRYELTEEQYTALRAALTDAGETFQEEAGEGTGGYLLIAGRSPQK